MQVDLGNSPNTSNIVQSILEPHTIAMAPHYPLPSSFSTILILLIDWGKKGAKVTNAAVGSVAY